MRIGVIGLGSWGTALTKVLLENGHEVVAWSRFAWLLHSLKFAVFVETVLGVWKDAILPDDDGFGVCGGAGTKAASATGEK